MPRILREKREAIIDRFVAELRSADLSHGATRAEIVDSLPAFLDEVVAAMERELTAPRTSLSGVRGTVHRHVGQRLRLGFDLDTVIAEHSLLRDCILAVLEESGARLGFRDFEILARCLELGIVGAVTEYADRRNEELRAEIVRRDTERLRLRTILEVLPVGVFLRDANGMVLETNVAAAELWGTRLPPFGPLDEVIVEREIELATPAGDHRTLLVSTRPIRDDEGRILGSISVHVDVTQRARRLHEAEEAVRAREEVLAIVAHDLRNPLAAIELSAQRLQRMSREDAARANVAAIGDSIRRSAERMNRLVTDLLDLSRMEAGRLSIVPDRCDLASTIAESIALAAPLAQQKAILITGPAESTAVTLAADRDRLMQVMSNLLGNAIKYTPEGGSITVEAQVEDLECVVAVRDTGPGIPKEQQPRVFERFWQPTEHYRKGTGLGLAITKGIVESHGGRIWVESTPGQGSTFWFTLPLQSGRMRRSSHSADRTSSVSRA